MYNAHRWTIVWFTLLALLLVAPRATMAVPLKRDRIDTFQLKSVTIKQRHEFTPEFATSLNDPYINTMLVGLRYAYHINEGIAFELSASFAYALETPLVEQLRTSGEEAILRDISGAQSNREFNPTLTRPQIFASGNLIWSPLIGKFAIGNSVFDTNIYLSVGAGYVMTNFANRQFHLPSFNFGLGWRTFLAKWLTFRLDLRDVVYTQKFEGSGVNADVLVHNVFFTIGLGILLPFEPIYG